MITIVTERHRINWLKYLIEEFTRINNARFTLEVADIRTWDDTSNNCIYYTKLNPGTGPWVQSRDTIRPDGQVEYLEDIFIQKGTRSDHQDCILGFDIFWNAFIYLSRLEEIESTQKNEHTGSYSFHHPRKDKSSFQIPVVNRLFDRFEKHLVDLFPSLIFEKSKMPRIELSHDLDYIEKTWPLRLKQTAFNTYNTVRSLPSFHKASKQIAKTTRFLFSSPSYWCFDYWRDVETRFKAESVFYVYSKIVHNKKLKSWILDPSYDIATQGQLKNELLTLHDKGWQIGLHGSYFSAEDGSLLKREKEKLENVLGLKVIKTRQHWLRYNEDLTPRAHEELFQFDSTLGWNDIIGFRAGCASRYRPYNHSEERPYKHWVTPQIIMDSTLYDYGQEVLQRKIQDGKEILNSLTRIKSAHCSISWHPRTCSSDYGWQMAYEQYLTLLSNQNFQLSLNEE